MTGLNPPSEASVVSEEGKVRWAASWSVSFAAALAIGGCGSTRSTDVAIEDCFESAELDARIWSDKNARDRYWFEGREESAVLTAQSSARRTASVPTPRLEQGKRLATPSGTVEFSRLGGPRDGDGKRVLALRAFPWDVRVDEDGRNVVKHELWLHQDRWIKHASESWYGFSLRVDFLEPDGDRTRFVVAQWKEEAAQKMEPGQSGGPFVALRVDGGQLIFTLQQDGCRVPLAAPAGWSGRVASGKGYAVESPEFRGYRAGAPECDTEIKVMDAEGGAGQTPLLPDPEPTDAAVRSPHAANWFDVAISIRSRASELGGQVELWVDGKKTAVATGPIGNLGSGASSYFKVGIYRDYDANECFVREQDGSPIVVSQQCKPIDLRFDNFRRGTSRMDVDPRLARTGGRNGSACAARVGRIIP